MNEIDGTTSWIKPIPRSLKVNVDVAIFKDSEAFGVACIDRNHLGKAIEAKACYSTGIINPKLAEAFGVQEALS